MIRMADEGLTRAFIPRASVAGPTERGSAVTNRAVGKLETTPVWGRLSEGAEEQE